MSSKIINYLGIDWGEKRIGLALGDSEIKIASPYKVVGSMDDVIKEINNENVDVVVLGKPLSITNYKLQITNEGYNEFIKQLKKKINIPVETIDERLSSKAADALGRGKKMRASRDAIAAMLILQTYLDKRNVF